MDLHRDLNLAYQKGIKNLTVYSDSLLLIFLSAMPHSKFHRYATTIRNVQDMISKPWEVPILHTLREANCVEDFLAKLGANSSLSGQIFLNHPLELVIILVQDASRTLVGRD